MKTTSAVKGSKELKSLECGSNFRSNGTRSGGRGVTQYQVINNSRDNFMECEGPDPGNQEVCNQESNSWVEG